jgi:hypothetical protein
MFRATFICPIYLFGHSSRASIALHYQPDTLGDELRSFEVMRFRIGVRLGKEIGVHRDRDCFGSGSQPRPAASARFGLHARPQFPLPGRKGLARADVLLVEARIFGLFLSVAQGEKPLDSSLFVLHTRPLLAGVIAVGAWSLAWRG